jgi:formylglycine-generating enzyme required for sulfatase activity
MSIFLGDPISEGGLADVTFNHPWCYNGILLDSDRCAGECTAPSCNISYYCDPSLWLACINAHENTDNWKCCLSCCCPIEVNTPGDYLSCCNTVDTTSVFNCENPASINANNCVVLKAPCWTGESWACDYINCGCLPGTICNEPGNPIVALAQGSQDECSQPINCNFCQSDPPAGSTSCPCSVAPSCPAGSRCCRYPVFDYDVPPCEPSGPHVCTTAIITCTQCVPILLPCPSCDCCGDGVISACCPDDICDILPSSPHCQCGDCLDCEPGFCPDHCCNCDNPVPGCLEWCNNPYCDGEGCTPSSPPTQSCCEPGPLTGYGCANCDCRLNVCAVDPSCCSTASPWTQQCANIAAQVCPTLCGCNSLESCFIPHNTPGGCNSPCCCNIVRDVMPSCNNDWTQQCVNLANCLCNPGGPSACITTCPSPRILCDGDCILASACCDYSGICTGSGPSQTPTGGACSGPLSACCNNDTCYNPTTHECCGGTVVLIGRCCNGQPMSSTQFCCSGIVCSVPCCGSTCCPSGHLCCNNVCFNPSTHKCCGNQVVTISTLCCNGSPCAAGEQCCSLNGVLACRSNCCGSVSCPSPSICCNNTCISLPSSCCGGTVISPPTLCCNSAPYNPGISCCVNNTICPLGRCCGATCCPSGQQCCNGVCCTAANCCGGVCLTGGQTCCNNVAIPGTSFCCDNLGCPDENFCCNVGHEGEDRCCNEQCDTGSNGTTHCCPPGKTWSSVSNTCCLDGSTSCPLGCCPSSEYTCCGNECCPTDKCCGSLCSSIRGACCCSDGICTYTREWECGNSCDWTGDSNCNTIKCVAQEGACCCPDGTCTYTSAGECGLGCAWVEDTDCTEIECTDPTPPGSCCCETTCTSIEESECDLLLCTWEKFGDCNKCPALIPGACCCGGTVNCDLPVENVSWNRTQDFTAATGLRLPTEAEWEYAYRAGTTTAFHSYPAQPTGFNNDTLLGNISWYDGNNGASGSSTYGTKAVGGKLANGFGLHDMSGNVWEWCQDWFGPYSSASVTNPTGPATGSSKTRRGGAYFLFSDLHRSSFRGACPPGEADPCPANAGLRAAMTATGYINHTVLEITPNPAVVTNITLRNAIIASTFPWRVLDNASNIEMLLVPAGTFIMGNSGSTAYPDGWADEFPKHQVTLTQAFYIGRYQVTQAQWNAKMGSNPNHYTCPTTCQDIPDWECDALQCVWKSGSCAETNCAEIQEPATCCCPGGGCEEGVWPPSLCPPDCRRIFGASCDTCVCTPCVDDVGTLQCVMWGPGFCPVGTTPCIGPPPTVCPECEGSGAPSCTLLNTGPAGEECCNGVLVPAGTCCNGAYCGDVCCNGQCCAFSEECCSFTGECSLPSSCCEYSCGGECCSSSTTCCTYLGNSKCVSFCPDGSIPTNCKFCPPPIDYCLIPPVAGQCWDTAVCKNIMCNVDSDCCGLSTPEDFDTTIGHFCLVLAGVYCSECVNLCC